MTDIFTMSIVLANGKETRCLCLSVSLQGSHTPQVDSVVFYLICCCGAFSSTRHRVFQLVMQSVLFFFFNSSSGDFVV